MSYWAERDCCRLKSLNLQRKFRQLHSLIAQNHIDFVHKRLRKLSRYKSDIASIPPMRWEANWLRNFASSDTKELRSH